MRRKVKRDQDFKHKNLEQDITDEDFKMMENHLSAMEDHLFNAGVAILQAAKTQEEIFNTSVEAIQEALELGSTDVEASASNSKKSLLYQAPDNQSQEISLLAVWEKLNKLEEGQTRLEQRLEYLIGYLDSATSQVSSKPQATKEVGQQKALESATNQWTEKSLKKEYKTLATLRAKLGIEAKSWKLAVSEANALKATESTIF